MSYSFSRAAEADIENIAREGLARFGTVQAGKYVDGLTRAFERIAGLPEAYRERIEFVPPQRVCRYGAHLIFYVAEFNNVRILRIRHGREDWTADD